MDGQSAAPTICEAYMASIGKAHDADELAGLLVAALLAAVPPDSPAVVVMRDGSLRTLVGVETERPCHCTTPPRLIPQDDRPDPNCEVCGGTGRVPCEPRLRNARLAPVPTSDTTPRPEER